MSSEYCIPDLIAKKRDGDELSEEEIHHFVKASYSSNGASESQIGAMLMAMYLKGLNREETVSLTKAMLSSGSSLTWPEEWQGSVADKHSTGGVGDKVSLALAPALAVCGVKVPMISGRGLGHTECQIDLFFCHLLSENPSALVLDVKVGKAAFATTEERAKALAQTMVGICVGLGIKAVALITTMDAPLGKAIGNSVEVAEAISCLNGRGPEDLKELVIEQGGYILEALNKAESQKAGAKLIADALENGKALQKFCDMLKAQGVSPDLAKNLCTRDADPFSILPIAAKRFDLLVDKSGIVTVIDALVLAKVSHKLGAGRSNVADKVDHGVGFVLDVRVGQFVRKDDKWVTVYHNGNLSDSQIAELKSALEINENGSTADKPIASRIFDVIDSRRRNSIFVGQ
ncbi:thymidine phosphorylase-like [Pocillopora damicornis]|uniref:thymidine phosphorylase-like n=1 Tax=Pocillopora damicornis TaxID=46731 RepID=UPI000F552638|nr:thymidine phosphorylase-like [Pocillopora damicornis]